MIKRITVVLGLLLTLQVSAQKSFERNTNVISFGADLGLYNYTAKVATDPVVKNNYALNKMLSVYYERGVTNWLGLGAKIGLSDYFSDTDSATGLKPSWKAIDVSLLANAHFLRSKHADLLAGFNIGYSNLNYDAKDKYISKATGGGMMFDLHFQPRFYFGKHIGMFLNVAYTHYGYTHMNFSNDHTSLKDVLNLKGGGVNFGLGLQVKF